MSRFRFYFQDSCENVAVTTFTPSNNGGKQAFTVTGYTLSDYVDVGDELAFQYDGNYYDGGFSIIDITGNQITMSFNYNAAITNVNTILQFSPKVECTPYNFEKGKFEYIKDKDNFFYRLKYSGKVRFKGDDYDYLYAALNEGCCSVTLKVYKLCESEYSLFYRSVINKKEGTWNESKCWFETEMLPRDKYECILSFANEPVNLYDITVGSSAQMQEDDEVEGNTSGPFWKYLIRAVAPAGAGTTYDNLDGGALFIEINGLAGYASDPVTGNAWTVFVREERVYIYDWNFDFTAPSLSGYLITTQVVFGDKVTVTYTRQVGYSLVNPLLRFAPEIVSVNNAPLFGDCEIAGFNTYALLYDPINDNCIRLQRYNFNPATDYVDYHCATLFGGISRLAAQCSTISGVTSDFFEMNPIGDTAGYASGYNYVTGELNKVAALVITTISEIITPSGTFVDPNYQINSTFESVMKNLRYIFNVYWFIDASNRLRIEHDSWFTNNLIVNLSATENNKYKKVYSYIKEDLPNRERFAFRYALNTDFRGVDIVYSNQCTNNPTVLLRQSDWTTDINYLRNADQSQFDGSAIVLFADSAPSDPNIIHETGVLTGLQMPNGHLSWSNLHAAYHMYGRVLEEGQMNLADETFLSFRKLRKQNGQKYIGCCLDIPENRGTVTTELGTGDATKIVYDINGNTFEFELNI